MGVEDTKVKKEKMKQEVTYITLSEMVDLALGTPEIGAVNFNVLHSVLHVLIHRLDLAEAKIEFRGRDAERIDHLADQLTGPLMSVSQYAVPISQLPAKATMSGRISSPALSHGLEKTKSITLKKKPSLDKRPSMKKIKPEVEKPIKEEKMDKKGVKKEEQTDDEKFERKDTKTEEIMKKEIKKEVKKELKKEIKKELKDELGKYKSKSESDVETVKAPSTQESELSDEDLDSEQSETIMVVHRMSSGGLDSMKAHDSKKKITMMQEKKQKLEQRVQWLEKQFETLGQLPSNEDLLKKTRSLSSSGSGSRKGSGSTELVQKMSGPVVEAFTMLNLRRRLEASEAMIQKIATLVEDLAKDTEVAQKAAETARHDVVTLEKGSMKKQTTAATSVGDRVSDLENRISSTEKQCDKIDSELGKLTESMAEMTGGGDESVIRRKDLDMELHSIRRAASDASQRASRVAAATDKIPLDSLMKSAEDLEELRGKMKEMEATISGTTLPPQKEIEEEEIVREIISIGRGSDAHKDRIDELEQKLNSQTVQLRALRTSISAEINGLMNQVTSLERDLAALTDKVNSEPNADSLLQDEFAGVGDVFSRLQQLQNEMEQLTNTAAKLIEEHELKKLAIDDLMEDLENVKNNKMDRADLGDLLADKADRKAVNRKVSLDHFETACDDLSRGLQGALVKLTDQKLVLSGALNDLMETLDKKMDVSELGPLKEAIGIRLKLMHEKIMKLASERKEREAMAAKKQILRDISCLSCDENAFMWTTERAPGLPVAPAMMAKESVAPRLAYQMDLLRRYPRLMHHTFGKNLIELEQALRDQQAGRTQKPVKRTKTAPQADICNRYCGGKHTVTSSLQRVSRPGNFLMQWGPTLGVEVPEKATRETNVRGTDGHLYRARATPPPPTPTPASPTSRNSEQLKSATKETKSRTKTLSIGMDLPAPDVGPGSALRVSKFDDDETLDEETVILNVERSSYPGMEDMFSKSQLTEDETTIVMDVNRSSYPDSEHTSSKSPPIEEYAPYRTQTSSPPSSTDRSPPKSPPLELSSVDSHPSSRKQSTSSTGSQRSSPTQHTPPDEQPGSPPSSVPSTASTEAVKRDSLSSIPRESSITVTPNEDNFSVSTPLEKDSETQSPPKSPDEKTLPQSVSQTRRQSSVSGSAGTNARRASGTGSLPKRLSTVSRGSETGRRVSTISEGRRKSSVSGTPIKRVSGASEGSRKSSVSGALAKRLSTTGEGIDKSSLSETPTKLLSGESERATRTSEPDTATQRLSTTSEKVDKSSLSGIEKSSPPGTPKESVSVASKTEDESDNKYSRSEETSEAGTQQIITSTSSETKDESYGSEGRRQSPPDTSQSVTQEERTSTSSESKVESAVKPEVPDLSPRSDTTKDEEQSPPNSERRDTNTSSGSGTLPSLPTLNTNETSDDTKSEEEH